MNKHFLLWFVLGLAQSFLLNGQTVILNSNQSLPLAAHAGGNTSIVAGHSVVIGANPSASNGYGEYLYLWNPASGLDDPTLANPTASPAETTTYILTVTDKQNCTAQDEVTVTVEANGIDISEESIDFKVYPNPANGTLILDVQEVNGSLIVKMFNSTGIIVYQADQAFGPRFHQELDTHPFPRGNYFVMLICNGRVITKPVMIL
jgi:hypothetical protein